jgi:dolichyl-phosphate beta-glucosyltransferase
MAKKLLSVIIPCRNQEDRLEDTFDAIKKYDSDFEYDLEVIFVNDRSTDKSRLIAEKRSKEFKNFSIMDTPKDFVGIGKGLAVKLGMSAAKGDIRLFMDADNSTKFSEIEKFLPYIEKYDIILGTRYSKEIVVPEGNWFKSFGLALKDVIDVLIYGHAKRYTAKKKQGRLREFVSRGGNLAFTVLLGQSFTDSRCGFKLYNAKATEQIFPQLKLTGWGFDTEALVLAKKYRYTMIEIPVEWFDDAAASNFGLKDMLDSFKEIFQIRYNLISRKYHKR